MCRVAAGDGGGQTVVGVGVGGHPAHRIGRGGQAAGRVVGPRVDDQVHRGAGVGRVAGVALQGGGQQVPVGVVGGVGFDAGRVGYPGLVAVGVVAEAGGVVGRVGDGGLLTVVVEGGRRGAGGVAAGQVGHGVRRDVAVGVIHRGGLPGVDRTGDPVGDRRLGLHPQAVEFVEADGGGQPVRVAVRGHLPARRAAQVVVG